MTGANCFLPGRAKNLSAPQYKLEMKPDTYRAYHVILRQARATIIVEEVRYYTL